MKLVILFILAVLLGALFPEGALADSVPTKTIIAVASNFTSPAKEIAKVFEKDTGWRVTLSFGSTGKLYTQISHGAPFDVFLAADAERPSLAEKNGLVVAGSRFNYGKGRLVLWSKSKGLVQGDEKVLKGGGFTRLAIANPKTSPYGAAAIEVLKGFGVYDQLKREIVRGENIAQTYQFAQTGNAELAFIAKSQLALSRHGSSWDVPETLHRPIKQQAALLKRGEHNETARAFLNFLKSEKAKKIISRFGYGQD